MRSSRSQLVLVLLLIGWKTGAGFCQPIIGPRKAKPKQRRITFDHDSIEICHYLDHVPFKEFLVDGCADSSYLQPAEYISQIKSPPDWGIIFERNSLPDHCSDKDESSAEYSLLDDFDALRLNGNCKRILDDSQLNAVELALRNKLVLIQVITGNSYVCLSKPSQARM